MIIDSVTRYKLSQIGIVCETIEVGLKRLNLSLNPLQIEGKSVILQISTKS